MEQIILRLPELSDARAIQDFRAEMLAAGSSMDGCGNLRSTEDGAAWVQDVRGKETEEGCRSEGIVPAHIYLAIRCTDGKILGMLNLRHHIDHPVLSVWGGHIGYCVRPSERRKGYATEMLRLALPLAKELGLQQVMVTCHEGNIGSEKVIRANGGVYEKTVPQEKGPIKRFWIAL